MQEMKNKVLQEIQTICEETVFNRDGYIDGDWAKKLCFDILRVFKQNKDKGDIHLLKMVRANCSSWYNSPQYRGCPSFDKFRDTLYYKAEAEISRLENYADEKGTTCIGIDEIKDIWEKTRELSDLYRMSLTNTIINCGPTITGEFFLDRMRKIEESLKKILEREGYKPDED